MKSWSVIFYYNVLTRNQYIIIITLIFFVGNVEFSLTAVGIVHLLCHDVTEDELFTATHLPPLELWYVIDGFQGVVVARARLCESVIGIAVLA